MEKYLSVVIATYNMEKYLRRCLDSLLIKDKIVFNKLEVLVINDGSKDSSSEIAHEYQNRYPNVFRVIDKENGNYGSCINRGIDEATGIFFKILDADDWYDNTALSDLIKSIDKYRNSVDVLFTEFTYHDFYKKRDTVFKFKTVGYDTIMSLKDISFADSQDEFMLKMYSVAIRLDILRGIRLRLDTGISYTDNEYMYFPYDHIGNVVFLPINIYQYFIGREGQTVGRKNDAKHLNDVLIITKRELSDYLQVYNSISDLNIRNVKRNMVADRCLAYFEQALAQERSEDNDNNIQGLYQMIKTNKELLNIIRRKSISFRIWERTGLYKTSLILKPLYFLKNHL